MRLAWDAAGSAADDAGRHPIHNRHPSGSWDFRQWCRDRLRETPAFAGVTFVDRVSSCATPAVPSAMRLARGGAEARRTRRTRRGTLRRAGRGRCGRVKASSFFSASSAPLRESTSFRLSPSSQRKLGSRSARAGQEPRETPASAGVTWGGRRSLCENGKLKVAQRRGGAEVAFCGQRLPGQQAIVCSALTREPLFAG